MNKIFQFITHMDARAARAVGVSVALLVVVGLVFLFGRLFFNAGAEDLGAVFQAAATHWYALPATILVYVLLSFAGAPQFVLMAATVLAFGPVYGFAYAWVATLVSSSVNFWLGRWFGADLLNRFGGDWVQRASDFVGRNGLWASALVRIVPSGPFIVVNMAFGVSRVPFWAFLTGTAIGITPKILVVGLTGQSVMALITGQGLLLAAAVAALVAIWVAMMLAARRRLPEPPPDDESA
ncbi:MAG: hypothetical protein CMF74_06705 [Maricaulis sp.]|jgi:uncharacterized membrane protein YdjX (TVP38/TMEM64 family)|nr:hypothetical protein [Maricaulis sp.]